MAYDGVDVSDVEQIAEELDGVFQSVYLAYHRRDGIDRGLSQASRGVLRHLAHSGPVTIGEAAAHLDRAQSVVSELVSQLERHGYVERRRDPDDRRRTLVWLGAAGRAELVRDSSVLDHRLLADSLTRLDPETVRHLLDGLYDLVEAARPPGRKTP